MTERCPKCGGPVERVGWNNNPDETQLRAKLDTLEDVETGAVAVARANRGDLAATLDEQHGRYLLALRRLFNGCDECGRKPR